MSYVVEPGTDPQEVRRRRRLAEALLQQGTDTSPILSPWQGAARLAQGLMGGYELGLEDKRDREMQANTQKANQGVLSAILGGGGDTGADGGGALPPTFTQFGTGGPSPGYVSKMLAGESKGDPNAVNPKSGATGSFQFLPSTWNGLVRQMPDKLTPDGIRDPAQQKVAMTAFTNQNGKVLSDAGFPVNDATLSLAHQQGAGGATALLKNPNANAIDVLTPLYKGNRAIATQAVVNNGGTPDMTAGQFAQKVSGYYNRQPGGGGGGTQVADANRIAAMVEAINNPNVSPQYKQMAIQEIQRLRAQTQQQNDPLRQLQMQKLRSDIEKANQPGADLEIIKDRAGNPIGSFNKRTGKREMFTDVPASDDLFSGNGESSQALNFLVKQGRLTKEQAAMIAAGKFTTGPDGSLLFVTPDAVFPSAKPAPNAPAEVPAGTAAPQTAKPTAETPGVRSVTAPKAEKPLTESESKVFQFTRRADAAQKTLETLEGNGTQGISRFLDRTMPGGNYILPTWNKDYQQFSQAKREFINALLRRESGAVIGKEEEENFEKQYMPMPGDSSEVIKQKRVARQRAIQAMKDELGGRYKEPTAEEAAPAAPTSPADLKKKYGLD